MMNFKLTFIISLFIFIWSSILLSQTNDTPLSFDKDIPFSLVSGYLFRGNDFFYEKTYDNIKKLKDCIAYIQVEGFINSNSKLVDFPKNGLDLTPTAYNASFEIKCFFTDISSPSFLFYQFYIYFRNYIYFHYSNDKDDNNSDNDVSFNGAYTSGIVSGALGFENNWFTPIIVWNRLEAEHENKENDLHEIPSEYHDIYIDRFNEVYSRFDSLGIEEKVEKSMSFIGYSRKLGVGCILAPRYTKIDLNFLSGINSNNSILPFSQHNVNVSSIIDFAFHTNIKHSVDYSIKSNYKKTNFKHLKNTVSDLTFDFTNMLFPDQDSDINKYTNFSTRFQFDHSINELASFEIGLKFYAFQVVYEYNNTKLFMPDVDRLYSNSIIFKCGCGFSKNRELIIL